MKKLFIFMLFGAHLLLTPLATASSLCQQGQSDDVLWEGYWMPAEVIATRPDACRIRYEGYGPEYDEWVGAERLRFPDHSQDIEAGTRIQVLFDGRWYPASVLRSRGNRYLINYDGWSHTWDEWVGPERIRQD